MTEAASHPPRAMYPAVLLASVGLLALEIVQVRIFSYAIDPLLVFSAISVAVLGLGAGGIVVSLRPSLARGDVGSRLAGLLAACGIAIVVAHAAFARTSGHVAYGTATGVVLASLPVLAVLVVPYLLGGVFLSVVLTRWPEDTARLYAVNLAGSAIGCLVVNPLLRPLGAETIVGGCAVLMTVAAFPLVASEHKGSRVTVGLALVVTLASTVTATHCFPFRPDPGDLYGMARDAVRRADPTHAALEPVREFARWDPLSRVEVYAFPGAAGLVNGTSPMRLFTQDGGAGSLLVDVSHDPSLRRAMFAASIWSAPYFVRPHPDRVLVIGLGGAPDVLAALAHGVRHITGVEINASTIDLVSHRYAAFLGDPYHRPEVEIVHRDGRSFVEQTREHYDVIQMTGADTYSAGAAGAFMFSESYLYTREAFARYLSVLTADGVLSITRFGPESLRIVTTAVDALHRAGIDHPERHLVILSQGISVSVIVSPREISVDQSRNIVGSVFAAGRMAVPVHIPVYEAMGFGIAAPISVAYAPGFAPPTPHAAFVLGLASGHGADLLAQSPLDLTPVDDDRPFFFQFYDRSRLRAALTADEREFLARGLRAHLSFLVTIAAIASALLLLPLWQRRREPAKGAARPLAFFAAIGAGYLLVEMILMQKSALYLGHPSYSVAVTLASLLVGSGTGSWLAARSNVPPQRLARGAAVLVAAVLIVAQLSLHALFRATLAWPFTVRVLVLGAVTFPVGLVMGVPFPSGLRATASRGERVVAWGLAMNQFLSVVASLIAVPLAMYGGFHTVMLAAAALYLLAATAAPAARGA